MRHSIGLTLMIGIATGALMMVAGDRGNSQSIDPNAAPNPYRNEWTLPDRIWVIAGRGNSRLPLRSADIPHAPRQLRKGAYTGVPSAGSVVGGPN